MLYFIFTVDGDWKDYFNLNLTEDKRLPQVNIMQTLIRQEIEVAAANLEGRFIHFIHTSPRARSFFFREPFLQLWQQIVREGGNLGLHCHEDDPYRAYYFNDTVRMRKIITEQTRALRSLGLPVSAYRGGFLAFRAELIPILEENNLRFDFSCEPGRYLVDKDTVVSDWRGSPTCLYRMSRTDHRREGDSCVYEVPIGTYKDRYLYFEKSNFQIIEEIATSFTQLSKSTFDDIVVSVLTHSYEYLSEEAVKNITEKISLLKQYGQFINLGELSEIIEEQFKKR